MSAACAPATATNPAAVPRRRLFVIFFISQPPYVVWEGSISSGASRRGRSPLAPLPPGLARYPDVPWAVDLTEAVATLRYAPVCRRMKLATLAAAHAIMK